MREFELLQQVFAANAQLPAHVTIPPGDDMGAVRLSRGNQVLVTVDQVADGVHFDGATASLDLIGRKAMTRNLSDVAAMGAYPTAAVAAACLPRSMSSAQARELCDALRRHGAAYGCPVIGGDVSVWDQRLILTVTILAQMARDVQPLLRRGAGAGDVVCVTGSLGYSLPTGRHLSFEPRLKVGQWLAGHARLRPTAMIDLSDGLARDLGHICEMSQVAAEIDADALPVTPWKQAGQDARASWEHALGDGEDYELCFTLPGDRAAEVPAEIAGVPIRRIGRIVPTEAHDCGVRVRLRTGKIVRPVALGWEHHGA